MSIYLVKFVDLNNFNPESNYILWGKCKGIRNGSTKIYHKIFRGFEYWLSEDDSWTEMYILKKY